MIDIDYAPAVFAMWIIMVLVCPAIYGLFVVDKYWKKNKEDQAQKNSNVFN
ncbi:MAG: hypothetical protein FD165_2555 [Gammaproteobacteria bacterium]|nr:MAG: hypothetical protein FD165_2555 [Gammaproteobacteria bacterium]TND02968.1 MAG: hypothetical protein FD120_2037 [Gammaproteobacteria bacterium]